MKKATWRNVFDWLKTLSEEQLDANLSVLYDDEFYSLVDADITFEINPEDDILDKGHPYIGIKE